MNEYFDWAFEYLLKDEGKEFTNDPDDSGGPTKFGITQKTYENHVGHSVSIDTIKNMTEASAKIIYFDLYWRPLKTDKINHLGVAVCLFNSAVLYGVGQAALFAQGAANKCGNSLKLDGKLGDKSVAAINALSPGDFITAFHGQVLARIDRVIAAKPKNEKYRKGWTNRANRLLALSAKVSVETKV